MSFRRHSAQTAVNKGAKAAEIQTQNLVTSLATVGGGGYTLNYLLVAGGGGGGSNGGAGGGAGGVWTGTVPVASPGTPYTIAVGGGGAINTNGQNTSAPFSPTCAVGGGKPNTSGGSGGGATGPAVVPGTPGQGNAGGSKTCTYVGGGGGAGSPGTPIGKGGVGSGSWTNIVQVAGFGQNITGTYYIAGGGGNGNPGNVGGYGGGGYGPSVSNSYVYGIIKCGQALTGGGGSGGQPSGPAFLTTAGQGGSGFAILWYTAPAVQGSGGSVYTIYPGTTATTTWIHAFNATGTYTT